MHGYLQFLPAALSLLPLTSAITLDKRQSVSTKTPIGWTYQGCYSDSVSNRVLSRDWYVNSTAMTEESCIAYCAATGYTVAGVEYADECYCGYQLASSAIKEADTDCNMACSGDPTELCGASNRLTVFSTGTGPVTNSGPDSWVSLGCYGDQTSARTLRYSESVPAGAVGMTVAQCTATCQEKYGFQYAGVEYANQCYCDNSLQNSAGPASDGCNMACSGNSSEYCGGPNRLNLYQLPSETSSPTDTLPAGWSARGCFTDSVSARTLSLGQAVQGGYTNMTIANCLIGCQSAGYSLAGVEYSQECYCDNQLKNGGSCASDQTTCNMPCKGNSAEACGGPNRLNMYQYGSAGVVSSCLVSQDATSATARTTTTTVTSISTTSMILSTITTSVIPTTSSSTVTTSISTSIPTTTAISSTTAVSTTIVTPTSTTTSTTSVCVPSATANTGYIIDGDFEDGHLTGWTASNNLGTVSTSVISNGLAYSGCSSVSLLPTPAFPPLNGQVSLSQTVTGLQTGQRYTFKVYQGRNSSAATTSNPVIALVAGSSTISQGTACGGFSPCNIQGNGGSVWQQIAIPFTALAPSLRMSIFITWADGVNAPEPLLIDDVSVA